MMVRCVFQGFESPPLVRVRFAYRISTLQSSNHFRPPLRGLFFGGYLLDGFRELVFYIQVLVEQHAYIAKEETPQLSDAKA